MAAIGYLFYIDSENEMESEDVQKKLLEDYAVKLDLKITGFYSEEDVSIRRPFRLRETGKKLLRDLRPGDCLFAAKAEWMLSSAKEGLQLLELLRHQQISLYCEDLQENISLASPRKLMVYEGGASLIQKLLTSLAACESTTHGESIKNAKRKMKREGKYLGGPVPFGWVVDGDYLKKDKDQQKIIREIKKLKADRWSYRDIAGKLFELHGIRLSHEGVRKIIINHERQG